MAVRPSRPATTFYLEKNMSFEINGKTYETDEEGYLLNLADWTKEAAEHLAEEEKVPLTDNHWEVINFLREYYNEYQIAPAVTGADEGHRQAVRRGKRQQQIPLRPVPLRAGQAGLQDRRPAQADRLYLSPTPPRFVTRS
jgi:TusE/DsrC/DsvC family sulfur relay protein